MSDKIDDNNQKINSGKRRINSLAKKKQTALNKAERLKKELEAALEEARNAELEQNKIRRKNRTHAMIQLATSIIKYFPVLEKQEKDLISANDFAALNNMILNQIDNSKKNSILIDWNCSLVNNSNSADTKNDTINKSDKINEISPNCTIPTIDTMQVMLHASEKQKEFLRDAWKEFMRVLQNGQTPENFTKIQSLIEYYKNSTMPNSIIDDFYQIRSINLDADKLKCLFDLHNT